MPARCRRRCSAFWPNESGCLGRYSSVVTFFLSLALVGLATTWNLALWTLLALVAGFGVGAIATVAPLFIIDFTSREEWEQRIGWLQSFNGAGQLIGLLIVGAVAVGTLAYGFRLAAACSLLAVAVGRIGLPVDGHRQHDRLPRLDWGEAMRGIQPAPPPVACCSTPITCRKQPCITCRPRALARLRPVAGMGRGESRSGAVLRLLSADDEQELRHFADDHGLPLCFRRGDRYRPVYLFGAYGQAVWTPPSLPRRAGDARVRLCSVLEVLGVLPISAGAYAAAISAFVVAMLAWPVLIVASTGLAARLTLSAKVRRWDSSLRPAPSQLS